MILYYFTPRDLPKRLESAMREHSVDMDDWDYLLMAPANAIDWPEDSPDRYETCGGYDPYSTVASMLMGPCDNVWYRVKYLGREWAVGMAYHA